MMTRTRSVDVGVAALAVALIMTVTIAGAASISADEAHRVTPGTYSVSMNNSDAFIKYSSGTYAALLTGSVVDYDFPEGGYKGSANVISNITVSGPGSRGSFDLWTETMDPASDPPISTGGDNGNPGSGLIYISTLTNGTVWILSGTWSGNITVDATMKDTDGILGDVVMTQLVQPDEGTRGSHYAFGLNFADAGEYEEISWAVTGSYFGGVVVTELDTNDTTPPTPNPMTWASVPAAISPYEITMTATTASDENGVAYQFTRYTNGVVAAQSTWQYVTDFTDTGLSPSTTYGYIVQARDMSASQNVNTASSPIAEATTSAEDTTPPAPSPMTWAIAPAATSFSEITMTATTATDASGVEYQFTRYTNGVVAALSAWQGGTNYVDTGLSPATTYGYTVQARDKSLNQNTNTASSPIATATTLSGDTTPPAPSQMTWAIAPAGISFTEITMTATTATDANGVEYQFTRYTNGVVAALSAWQDGTSYTDTGLSPNTTYGYTVQARDKSVNQNANTASSPIATATTLDPPPVTGTLTDVSTVAAGGNSLISVSPTHYQGFSANSGTVDTPFNAPVLDYGFYNRNSAFGSSLPGGGSRIGSLTNQGGGNDYTDYWISSDPLTQPADQADSGSRTLPAPDLTSGTINISELSAGSLYIFHGRWQNGATDYLSVVMSGAGQLDVTLANAGVTVNGGPLMWATQIDFTNPENSYDTITFTHYVNDGAGGGYMSGTVLTVPPPPAGTMLYLR